MGRSQALRGGDSGDLAVWLRPPDAQSSTTFPCADAHPGFSPKRCGVLHIAKRHNQTVGAPVVGHVWQAISGSRGRPGRLLPF